MLEIKVIKIGVQGPSGPPGQDGQDGAQGATGPMPTTLGPFKNDKEAAANGIAVGDWYLGNDGRTRQRRIPTIGAVAPFGSSSMIGSNYVPGSNLRNFYGESMVDQALAQLRHPVGYVRSATGQYHFATAGALLETQLTGGGALDVCLDRCDASGVVCLVICQIGRNDIAATGANADNCIALIEAMIERIHTRGHWALVVDDQPRLYNDGSVTPPDERLVKILQDRVNDAVPAVCARFGALHASVRHVGEDSTNRGYVLAEKVDTVRPGHAKVAQGMDLGSVLYRVMEEEVPFVRAGTDLWDLQAYNILTNFRFTGSGGGGGRPDGWSGTQFGGDMTQAFSMVNYDDFATTGRRWLRGTNANGNTGGEFFYLTLQASLANFVAGDVIQFACDLRFHTDTSFAIGAVGILVSWSSPYGEATAGLPGYALPSPPTVIPRTRNTMLLRTMPETMPSGPTAINVQIRSYGNGPFDVGSPMVLKNAHEVFAPHFPTA
jgi:hypothetical protein